MSSSDSSAAQVSAAQRHIEAMDKLASLVSVRERCAAESVTRLEKSGFTHSEAQEAVRSAVECGLVSDERYARALVHGKTHAGWGRAKIVARLRHDGVADDVIDACSDAFSSDDEEFERALNLLQRKGTLSSDPYGAYMRRLISRGFSQDLARRAVEAHMAALEDC